MQQPNAYEIDEVGNAFITIGSFDYTPTQKAYLDRFLRDYGQDLNENEMKKIFSDKIEIIDAIKVLYAFANHYQDEKDVFSEFKDEMDELIITLNGKNEGIIIG